jgi:5'-nucleotidase
VETIVVLAHAGAPEQDESDAPELVGEIVDETREMSPAVDVVIAGHSHSRLDLRVPNANGQGDKLVVEASSYGVAFDLVDLTVDTSTGDVVAKSGRVPETDHADALPDAEVAELVSGYRARVAPLATRVVGRSETALTRSGGTLGRLAAEAERAFARTDAAVVHRGALRADIEPGPITYAEVAEALAYDHRVMRFELTGRELAHFAEHGAYVAGPSDLEPGRVYSVAASEMLAPQGRPLGTEVEAVSRYLTRR